MPSLPRRVQNFRLYLHSMERLGLSAAGLTGGVKCGDVKFVLGTSMTPGSGEATTISTFSVELLDSSSLTFPSSTSSSYANGSSRS